MFTYFIAGVPKRPDFGHIKVIVEKLKRSLPHFSYEILVKTEDEYQVSTWLLYTRIYIYIKIIILNVVGTLPNTHEFNDFLLPAYICIPPTISDENIDGKKRHTFYCRNIKKEWKCLYANETRWFAHARNKWITPIFVSF